MKHPLLAVQALIICFLISCTALSAYAQPEEPNYQVNDIFNLNDDVYMVGSYADARLSFYSAACYWKNSKLFPLTNHDGVVRDSCTALRSATENNDIYIIGQSYKNEDQTLFTYWKNGKWERNIKLEYPKPNPGKNKVYMPNQLINIIDVAVYHNDIYILGSISQDVYYWKNGELFTLNPPKSLNIKNENLQAYTAIGLKLFIHDGNVYVAGYINYSDDKKPAYWKDGECHLLALSKSEEKTIYNTNNKAQGKASAIFVNEKGVWLSGTHYQSNNEKAITACYWKNNELINLSSEHAKATTTSILVKGNDVYIGGSMKHYDANKSEMACYWQNEQLTPTFETNNPNFDPSVITIKLTDNQITAYIIRDSYSCCQSAKFGYSIYQFNNGKLKAIKLETPNFIKSRNKK